MSTATLPRPTARRSAPRAPRPAAPTRGTSAPRLTRRGRAALFLLALATLGTLALSLGPMAIGATHSDGPATAIVVVEPGQSLWSVARAVRPGTDPRETIERIRSLNGLSSVDLAVGQTLIVPAGR
jgi:hypothetical protein